MARKCKPWYWTDRKRWATTVDGRRIVAPEHVQTEHEAWAWHAELMDELRPKPVSVASVTVGDVMDAYCEWDATGVADGVRSKETADVTRYNVQIAANTRIGGTPFGLMLASRLTPAHYESLVTSWRKAGYKPGFVASLAKKVKMVLAWGAKAGVDRPAMVESSPFRDCRVPVTPRGGERYGDREMAARWLRWLWRTGRRRDALFQRCLIHTGARPSELAWAEWSDVQWDALRDRAGNAMAVVVREKWKNSGKSGKSRRVYLPSRLVRAMKRRRDRASSPLIFPSRRGRRQSSDGLAKRTWDLRNEAVAAGVDLGDRAGRRMTNYLWRHTAASTLLMNGVDAATVAELLGTSVHQIQRTYGHLLEDHLVSAVDKIGKRIT